MKPRNVIGSRIVPGGDEKRRRSTMESKFTAIIAVSQGGQHYFEVLERNVHVNGERNAKRFCKLRKSNFAREYAFAA